MEECEIGNRAATDSDFSVLVEAMQSDLYRVRFFARPRCSAPDLEGAVEMLDHLIRDVEAREDFAPEQKAELASVIGARRQWYAISGLCRGSRA